MVPSSVLYFLYNKFHCCAHFTANTSTELMSGAKSREWVHQNSTNQLTNHLGHSTAVNKATTSAIADARHQEALPSANSISK